MCVWVCGCVHVCVRRHTHHFNFYKLYGIYILQRVIPLLKELIAEGKVAYGENSLKVRLLHVMYVPTTL